ncbi:MAG: MCE family protein [Candidatus Omnitrophica bacterium]|nr:MCE family protein [Candidatus Omnitrophota bacterium]
MKNGTWDFKKYFLEMKVGGFFVIALILLLITLLSIREVTFWKGTYVIKIKFYFAEGLRPASPVRFCGVDVGEVKKVEIKEQNGQPIVYVYAKVEEGVRIPKGSSFIINSLSLFGEKYLEIIPPEKITGYFAKDEAVEGVSPIPLFTVIANFHKTMGEVNDFVKNGKMKNSFENIVTNTEAITFNIRKIVEDIQKKEGTIGKFLYDDALYRKTEEFMDDLKSHPWKLLYKPRETRTKDRKPKTEDQRPKTF